MLPHSFRYFVLSVLSLVVVLATVLPVAACSCGPNPTVLDAFENADEVVILRALSVEKAPEAEQENYIEGIRSVTMVVEKVFKGKLKVRDEIVFGQGGGADCIWTFEKESVGKQFLFYLARPEKFRDAQYMPPHDPASWFAFECGRSSVAEVATEDLLYLEKMDKVRGKTRISGSIGAWLDPDMDLKGKESRLSDRKRLM